MPPRLHGSLHLRPRLLSSFCRLRALPRYRLRALADGAGATLVADDVPDRRVESALALMGVPLSVRAASPRVVAGGEAYHESGAAEGA